MSKLDLYVTSLYWALTTMTTVGFGDITPKSSPEKIYSMLIVVIACGTFAYILGNIGGAISDQNKEEAEHRRRTVLINRYMRRNKIPFDL
jgi:hypothetical protein